MYHPINIKTNTEKLKTKALLHRVAVYRKKIGGGKTGVVPFSFREDNLVINLDVGQNGQFSSDLDYTEEDVNTGKVVRISGNERNGYIRQTYNVNFPEMETVGYYPSGNVQGTDVQYSDRNLKHFPGDTHYPIGRSFLYNESGGLIKATDMNDVFKFSIKDVRKLLSQRDPNAKIYMINGSTYPDGSFWKISFLSETLGTCYMVIDASDGRIITDYKHIINTYIE